MLMVELREFCLRKLMGGIEILIIELNDDHYGNKK